MSVRTSKKHLAILLVKYTFRRHHETRLSIIELYSLFYLCVY